MIDKETKKFNFTPIFPCRFSWNLVGKVNATLFSTTGKYLFKHWMTKNEFFRASR